MKLPSMLSGEVKLHLPAIFFHCICGCWYAPHFVERTRGVAVRCPCCLRQTKYTINHREAYFKWQMMQVTLKRRPVAKRPALT